MNNIYKVIGGFFILFSFGINAQNITRIEYFVNNDPGFGLGTEITGYTPSANIVNLSTSINLNGFTNGINTLYIRTKDANNHWSLTNHTTFIKIAPVANITAMEYFVNTDPGFGLGTQITGYTPSANIVNLSANINLNGFTNGINTLYIRTKDSNNHWSLTNHTTFIKIAPVANITAMEYFVDTDPGFGLATSVVITPSQNISNFTFPANLTTFSIGNHNLFVRAKDANGKWSLTNVLNFEKTASVIVNSNAITVQPVTTPICKLLGATASISVVASASPLPVYKWYSQLATSSTASWVLLSDNANYAGTGSSNLSITRSTTAIPATGTKYKVEVSGNGYAAVMSSVVSIQDQTVLSKAKAITAKSSSNAALLPALTTCSGSTLNLSLATGSIGNIQWMISTNSGATWTSFASYTQTALSATNGVLSATSPVLTTGSAWFKVVASNGSCTSADSALLKITVSALPVAGVITGGNVTVCIPLATGIDTAGTALTSTNPITNSTVLTLGGSTNVGTIVWQKSINYTAAIPTWAAVANLVATTAIGASYSGAGTTALTVGNLAADTWYRAQVTNGACVDYAPVVKLTVSKAAVAGVITSATTACFGGNITFTSAAYTGTSLQWEVSTVSATTGFVPVSGQTGLTFNMTGVAYAPLSKFYVRTTVTSGSCTIARSAVKTITVNPLSVGGTVKGNVTVCSLGTTTLTLAGSTGTIQWKYSTDGTSYSNVPVGTATASTFGTTSANGTSATYVVKNVSGATYFKAVVTSGVCSSSDSTVAQVVVGSSAAGGTVSASSPSVCYGTAATITLTGNVGSIVWQKSTNYTAAIPTWAAVTTSVSSMLSTGNLTVSTAYRAVSSIGTCAAVANSNVVVVAVINCIVKEAAPVAVVQTAVPFGVVAYPNPSSESFNFTLTSSSEDKVNVVVYDMTGKLIDQREVTPSEVSELQVGDRYPSGVYNVIVTQGENAKTLRVIKR
jgi:hypothetical protein